MTRSEAQQARRWRERLLRLTEEEPKPKRLTRSEAQRARRFMEQLLWLTKEGPKPGEGQRRRRARERDDNRVLMEALFHG